MEMVNSGFVREILESTRWNMVSKRQLNIIRVLKLQVGKRDAEFFLLEDLEVDIDYKYKTPAFPHGIRGWYAFQFTGISHEVRYAESSSEDLEWETQRINCESEEYTNQDNEDSKSDSEEEEECDEDQKVNRHCAGCEEPIEEEEGYRKCVFQDGKCHLLFHCKFSCHGISEWEKTNIEEEGKEHIERKFTCLACHCASCGNEVENKYVRCSKNSCGRVFHLNYACHKLSYSERQWKNGEEFVCKYCKRGNIGEFPYPRNQ